MTPIEEFPMPFPLYIMKDLTDLKSLDSLCRSSPRFNVIFHVYAAEVVEHIMRETLQDEVIVELRAHTLVLLQRPSQLQTESDFSMLYERANRTFDSTTPVMAISDTIRTFSWISSICDMIMRMKLDELRALPFERLGDRHFRGHLAYGHLIGTPYSIARPSPPD